MSKFVAFKCKLFFGPPCICQCCLCVVAKSYGGQANVQRKLAIERKKGRPFSTKSITKKYVHSVCGSYIKVAVTTG